MGVDTGSPISPCEALGLVEASPWWRTLRTQESPYKGASRSLQDIGRGLDGGFIQPDPGNRRDINKHRATLGV